MNINKLNHVLIQNLIKKFSDKQFNEKCFKKFNVLKMIVKEIKIKPNKQREIIITLSLETQKELNQVDYKKRGLNKWLMD